MNTEDLNKIHRERALKMLDTGKLSIQDGAMHQNQHVRRKAWRMAGALVPDTVPEAKALVEKLYPNHVKRLMDWAQDVKNCNAVVLYNRKLEADQAELVKKRDGGEKLTEDEEKTLKKEQVVPPKPKSEIAPQKPAAFARILPEWLDVYLS